MKQENLIKKLEKNGYQIKYGKCHHWDYIPYITRQNDCPLFLTGLSFAGNTQGIFYDDRRITYDKVIEIYDNTDNSHVLDCCIDLEYGDSRYYYMDNERD